MTTTSQTTHEMVSGSLIMSRHIHASTPIPSLFLTPYAWSYYLSHDTLSLALDCCIGRSHGWKLIVPRWERRRATRYWQDCQQLWTPFLEFWVEYQTALDLLILPILGHRQGELRFCLNHATARVPGRLVRWELIVDMDECLARFEDLATHLVRHG